MSNILDSLKKLTEWQRIINAADKVPELERRVQELENKLADMQPNAANTCPYCGAKNAWFKESSRPMPGPFAQLGVKLATYKCKECGKGEEVKDK